MTNSGDDEAAGGAARGGPRGRDAELARLWRGVDAELNVRLAELADEGREIWNRFDMEVRRQRFHPFVPADYDKVLTALLRLREPGLRFLEWGSATGVITIMADLLGYEAYGIELDERLVEVARDLARRYGSRATFVAGSLFPEGYRYRPPGGDARLGTIGTGRSGYLALGQPLESFDIVYVYAWPGEDAVLFDVMRQFGRRDARLLLNTGTNGLKVYRGGTEEAY
jgi:hypothetical protein